MRKVHPLTIVAGVMLAAALAAGGAEAAPPGSSPMEVLKGTNDKIANVLKKKVATGSAEEKKQDEKIRKIINKLLDFPALTQSAMGKHWETLTKEQQKEITDLLTELIQRNYIKQVHKRKDEKWIVNYVSEDVQDIKATVVTTIVAEERHDEETEVVYKMKKKGPKWVVTDIETDGVSLVRNYRSQFNKIIEKDGVGKLIEKMQNKVKSGAEDDTL